MTAVLLLYNCLKFMRYFHHIVVFLIIIIFCYFRIKPIYLQTVPYIYDQGRDFLKAGEIIRDRHLLAIGPTTGVPGLFHGVWWYYLLAVFYALFNGLPQGFYIGMFFFTSLPALLFFFFLRKELNQLSSFLFLSLITISPYFIRASFFAANNFAAPVFVLVFLYALYMFLKMQSQKWLFLIALVIGLAGEFELSFGFLLLPAFILTTPFFGEFRRQAKKIKSIMIFLSGLMIPFTPRILFEIKNRFIQTRSMINFVTHAPGTNQQSLVGAIRERASVFLTYYTDIFYIKGLAFIFLIVFVYFLLFKIGRVQIVRRKYAFFLLLLVFFLFILSLTNKNNFFWSNYLEGIQYIFLVLIVVGVDSLLKTRYTYHLARFSVMILVLVSLYLLYADVANKYTVPGINLRSHLRIVNYLYQQSGDKKLCVRVYTPPVVPYTYRYLFDYYSRIRKHTLPTLDYVDGRCWYIMEEEQDSSVFRARITKWRREHIPVGAQLIKTHIMETGTQLEYWRER